MADISKIMTIELSSSTPPSPNGLFGNWVVPDGGLGHWDGTAWASDSTAPYGDDQMVELTPQGTWHVGYRPTNIIVTADVVQMHEVYMWDEPENEIAFYYDLNNPVAYINLSCTWSDNDIFRLQIFNMSATAFRITDISFVD